MSKSQVAPITNSNLPEKRKSFDSSSDTQKVFKISGSNAVIDNNYPNYTAPFSRESTPTAQSEIESFEQLELELAKLEFETDKADDFLYNALGSYRIQTAPAIIIPQPNLNNTDFIGIDEENVKEKDQSAQISINSRANDNNDTVKVIQFDQKCIDNEEYCRRSSIVGVLPVEFQQSSTLPDVFVDNSKTFVQFNIESFGLTNNKYNENIKSQYTKNPELKMPINQNSVTTISNTVDAISKGKKLPRASTSSSLDISKEKQDPKKKVALKNSNKSQPLQQLNGSVHPQEKPTGGPKHRFLHSEMSAHGQSIDASILRTELVHAVEHNKVDKVRRILSSGIDPNSVCDEKGRWPIHIAALLGHSSIIKMLIDHGAQKDQPDTTLERTPLMYAAATSPETVELLISSKVNIHSRNKFGATALHYASGAGQHECCRLLAAAGCDIQARDRQKLTPLHMACRIDDIRSIDILLEYGADIHARDGLGKTCLHHAAETCEGMESDCNKMGATFRKLVTNGITVNAIDQDGKNALYYAIQTGSQEAVSVLYELGANLQDGVSLLAMAKKFPHLIPPFLDKNVTSNIDTTDVESKQFYIQFDYTPLTVFPKDIPNDKLLLLQNRQETESILAEMGVLHGLTKCKDTSILSHPVCESLLRLKWKKVKWYLYLDMLLFAVFLAFLTAVIFMEYESDSTATEHEHGGTTEIPEANGSHLWFRGLVKRKPTGLNGIHERHCMDSTRNIIVWSILWVLTALLGIREMIQLIQSPLHYVIQVENMLELVLVSSVALLSLAECGVESFVSTRDHFAAVCLIVGWTIQVTLYGKIPVFGVYIRMFAAVATNILKCMFTYLGLLFAFSLTLHFLFRTQRDFDSVGFTFLKTFAMMIGEVELARTFIDSRGTDAVIVPFTSHLVVALFIIFISIILSSLFIALAVCDISSMQREGEYMQLVQQVKVASQLEDALQKRSLLYPQFGMKDMRSLHQRKGIIFPNLKDHGKLSKDAIHIVMTHHTKRLENSSNNGIASQAQRENSRDRDFMDYGSSKIAHEMVDDLVSQIKTKMDKYTVDIDKRNGQLLQDMRGSQERESSHLMNQVHSIQIQLEDIQNYLRELGGMVNKISEETRALQRGEDEDRQNLTKSNLSNMDEVTIIEDGHNTSTSPDETTTTESGTVSSASKTTKS